MSDAPKSDEHALIPANSIRAETQTNKGTQRHDLDPPPLSTLLNTLIMLLVRLAFIIMAMITFLHTGSVTIPVMLLYIALHPDRLRDNGHLP